MMQLQLPEYNVVIPVNQLTVRFSEQVDQRTGLIKYKPFAWIQFEERLRVLSRSTEVWRYNILYQEEIPEPGFLRIVLDIHDQSVIYRPLKIVDCTLTLDGTLKVRNNLVVFSPANKLLLILGAQGIRQHT